MFFCFKKHFRKFSLQSLINSFLQVYKTSHLMVICRLFGSKGLIFSHLRVSLPWSMYHLMFSVRLFPIGCTKNKINGRLLLKFGITHLHGTLSPLSLGVSLGLECFGPSQITFSEKQSGKNYHSREWCVIFSFAS